MFNGTVTFLLSRPHVVVRVENCFCAKFASIVRMFRASEYSHTAKIVEIAVRELFSVRGKIFRHVLSKTVYPHSASLHLGV